MTMIMAIMAVRPVPLGMCVPELESRQPAQQDEDRQEGTQDLAMPSGHEWKLRSRHGSLIMTLSAGADSSQGE
jgi:hypothetical protein